MLYNNLRYSIYLALGIVSNPEMIRSIGENVCWLYVNPTSTSSTRGLRRDGFWQLGKTIGWGMPGPFPWWTLERLFGQKAISFPFSLPAQAWNWVWNTYLSRDRVWTTCAGLVRYVWISLHTQCVLLHVLKCVCHMVPSPPHCDICPVWEGARSFCCGTWGHVLAGQPAQL